MTKRPLLAALALTVALALGAVPAAGIAADLGALPLHASQDASGETSPVQLASPSLAVETRSQLESIIPPARDESDLARRFKMACGAPAPTPIPSHRDAKEGDKQVFYVLDEPTRAFLQVQATLQYVSPHLLFYVQDGTQVKRETLADSADTFETKTWPLLKKYFATPETDPQITIFNGRLTNLGGYFSSSDLLAKEINPYSNERTMLFMSVDAHRPGTFAYDTVLAHETQHYLHFLVHPQQDSWINEGASELAMALTGDSREMRVARYLAAPETQLDAWADDIRETTPHYGGGYLMLEYFAQRAGGYDAIKGLIASPGTSIHTFDAYFEQQHSPLRFETLFKDFVLTNLLNNRSLGDGRYGYEKISGKVSIQDTLKQFPATATAVLHPYATRYTELQPSSEKGTLQLRFSGAAAASLYRGASHSGQEQWWGNGADNMESTLTRQVDLTDVQQASLHFSTWFDTERSYDYAGVAVSTDDGCTWKALQSQDTTDDNPTGQNPGHAFNGLSGGSDTARWVDETMDLTPYAGKKPLIRFFYVTDQSYHGDGFAVDDISIPEIGFKDDAESDAAGWEARGFLRSANAASVDWAVQVVAYGDGDPQILQMPVKVSDAGDRAEGTLSVPSFGDSVKRVVVAVSPLVPVTQEPADFSLSATLGA